jgi:hypothetical protein
MVSLYLTKCHRILDHHKVEVAVVIVDSTHKNIIIVVYGKLEVLKILMSVISGEKDISKDNETYNDYLVVSYI